MKSWVSRHLLFLSPRTKRDLSRSLIGTGVALSFLGLVFFASEGIADKPVTFSEEIVRLFAQHCQLCHRPGGGAPFSLLTYGDAYLQRYQILHATQSRRMPPWKPVPGYGEFVNERRLSGAEVSLITRWVEGGAPEGDARHLPSPKKFPETWSLGQPDLIFSPDAAFTMSPDDKDAYRCFSVATEFKEDRYVSASEVIPGNRRIVHHVLVYIDTTGRSLALDRADPEPGYQCFGSAGVPTVGLVAAWVPGSGPQVLPAEVGLLIRRRSRLVIQVHYHRDHHDLHQRPPSETDRTQVGIYLAKRVDRQLRVIDVRNMNFVIPAGAERYAVRAEVPVLKPIEVVGVAPHMHLLGRKMKVWALLPDGTLRHLIYIDDWDFGWQGAYMYKNPVALPMGTRIHLQAIYDNSASNPRNPRSPPGDVRWGERSEDEMCLAYVLFTLDGEKLGYEAR